MSAIYAYKQNDEITCFVTTQTATLVHRDKAAPHILPMPISLLANACPAKCD